MAKQLLMPEFGQTIKLKDFDPNYTDDYDKSDVDTEINTLRDQMREYQERLFAENKQSLLIVLQAMDAGGKDGTIRRVFTGVNPQGVQVVGFKAPTEEELSHDFLWRIHQHAPRKGQIVIFNRSHYEDVLIGRVKKLASPAMIERRYEHINNFERLLVDSGTHILKFYLHISKEEQKERFLARLNEPEKQWKFNVGDLPVRNQWDDYMQAFEHAITRCHTPSAPWFIVPANKKWYRDLVVMRTIVEQLQKMDPHYPPPEDDLSNVVIPD